MAMALLDTRVSPEEQAVLEDGEIPTAPWSRETIDTRHIDQRTERGMERLDTGRCPEVGCSLNSYHRSRQLYHTESYALLYHATPGTSARIVMVSAHIVQVD